MIDPVLALLEVPSAVLRWPVVLVALALAVILGAARIRGDLLERMGLETPDIALLTVGAVAAPALNIPLGIVHEAVLAVNLGGAIVPLLVIIRLRRNARLPLFSFLVLLAAVAAVSWWVVDVDPRSGVVAPFPWFLAPAGVAAIGALVLQGADPVGAGPLAFASGSMGALVGADLLALPELAGMLEQVPAGSAVVLGGAGSLDLIFLTGALALAACLMVGLGQRGPERVGDPEAAPLRIPRARELLREAERLPGLSPREQCLSRIAKANLALEQGKHRRAVDQAYQAAGSVLNTGDPSLAKRASREAPSPVQAWMQDLQAASSNARRDEPTWPEAADAVEAAKSLCGALWRWSPGRVRLEGYREA